MLTGTGEVVGVAACFLGEAGLEAAGVEADFAGAGDRGGAAAAGASKPGDGDLPVNFDEEGDNKLATAFATPCNTEARADGTFS